MHKLLKKSADLDSLKVLYYWNDSESSLSMFVYVSDDRTGRGLVNASFNSVFVYVSDDRTGRGLMNASFPCLFMYQMWGLVEV